MPPVTFRPGSAAALFLIAGMALVSLFVQSWNFTKITTSRVERAVDPVTAFEARFSPLKMDNPIHGPVGYLGDRKPKDLQSVMAFMLTQYTLAPVVVEQGAAHEFVIGNFFSAPPTSDQLLELKLEMVRDFQNGVVLYRRVP